MKNKKVIAYIIGIAIGDGNLSNPNGRAVRLRVTCDIKYPKLIDNIKNSLKILFPLNKVSEVKRKNCIDISCYSNKLEKILGWRAKDGPKETQKITIPKWVLNNKTYLKEFIRGLIQTDGSIYTDRGYKMINFTTVIDYIAQEYYLALQILGYNPQIRRVSHSNKIKYVIRLSRDVDEFIKEVGLWKQ